MVNLQEEKDLDNNVLKATNNALEKCDMCLLVWISEILKINSLFPGSSQLLLLFCPSLSPLSEESLFFLSPTPKVPFLSSTPQVEQQQ